MEFKLQFRLWHLFALTAIIAALCAVPPLGLVSAGVLLVSLVAYALDLRLFVALPGDLRIAGNVCSRDGVGITASPELNHP